MLVDVAHEWQAEMETKKNIPLLLGLRFLI